MRDGSADARGARHRVHLLGLLGVCVWPAAALAEVTPPAVTFVDGELTTTFGDDDDVVTFLASTLGADAVLEMTVWDDAAGDWTPRSPLLFEGQPIVLAEVRRWVIQLGGGADNLVEPYARAEELWIYGGPGDDVIKVAPGHGKSYVYGGPGNDQLNAEHAQDNWLYGEDGDDTLFGSTDGANLLDGGPGSNYLYPFQHILQPPLGKKNTVLHHQGALDLISDMNGDNLYQFVSDGSGAAGSVIIMENGGYDVLDFSQWGYDVTVDTASTEAQVVSRDLQGNPVLTLQLMFGGIEQVILPERPPEDAGPVDVSSDASPPDAASPDVGGAEPPAGDAALTDAGRDSGDGDGDLEAGQGDLGTPDTPLSDAAPGDLPANDRPGVDGGGDDAGGADAEPADAVAVEHAGVDAERADAVAADRAGADTGADGAAEDRPDLADAELLDASSVDHPGADAAAADAINDDRGNADSRAPDRAAAGTEAQALGVSDGCSCGEAGGRPALWAAALLGLGAAIARRRRR